MIEWEFVWICGFDKDKKEPCHAALRCFVDKREPMKIQDIIQQVTSDFGWIFVSSQNITAGTDIYYGMV